MMISQTTEYALRAVVYLANCQRESDTDDPVSQTVQQIAAATQVPMNYLSKVLQQLTRGATASLSIRFGRASMNQFWYAGIN